MSKKRLQEHKTQTEHLLRKRKVTKQAAAHDEPKQMRLQMENPPAASAEEPGSEFSDEEEQGTVALCGICKALGAFLSKYIQLHPKLFIPLQIRSILGCRM